MSGYFKNIGKGIKTSVKGLRLTLRHFTNARKPSQPVDIQDNNYFSQGIGIVTLQYPHQKMDVPDNGRYQLDCEIDDCIVCDKCAKICPVDCIEIEAIKSPDLIGYASDGSPIRLHAAQFDIDMAKCCFCGLCTTVCPTECLTMNSEYDYSSFDIRNFNFKFANLTAEQADEKRKLYDQFLAEKQAASAQKQTARAEVKEEAKPVAARPVFKPSFKKPAENVAEVEKVSEPQEIKAEETPKPKPVFKPTFKKSTENVAEVKKVSEPEENRGEEPPKPKPVFKPTFKPQPPKNKE